MIIEGSLYPSPMTHLYCTVRRALYGAISGIAGGTTAGSLFGLAMAFYDGSRLPGSLTYLPGSLLIAGSAGLIVGVPMALAIPFTKPYLLSPGRVMGGVVAAMPTILLLNSDMPFFVSMLIVGTAAVAGVAGGTVAYRCFQWLNGP